MKLLIISDSHGHIANLKHVMGFAEKLKVDGVIHCGDWNTLESIETVLSYKIPVYTVLGNADIDPTIGKRLKVISKACHQMVGESFSEDFLIINIGGRNIGIVHRFKIYDSRIKNLDIIFTGHHHSNDDRIVNGVRVVRPGAIIKGNNFATYDTLSNNVESISDDEI